MKPTKFTKLNALLSDFTAGHKRILGDNLIGLYLQGSAAVGDMDENSDVDFIGVVQQEIEGAVLEDLREFQREIFDRTPDLHWAERLEGSYFPLSILEDNSALDKELLYLDNGAREMTRDTHCNTLVVRWCLYEYAIPLTGPACKTLMSPVSTDLMKAEVHKVMADWEGWIHDDVETYLNRFYQQFVTISYCRMLHTLATGRVNSKPAGMRWGLANVDPEWHELIEAAQSTRDDPAITSRIPISRAEIQRTLEFVTYANSISERYFSQEQIHV